MLGGGEAGRRRHQRHLLALARDRRRDGLRRAPTWPSRAPRSRSTSAASIAPARIASKPLYRESELSLGRGQLPRRPALPRPARLGAARGRRHGRLRDHLVRPGHARRGRLLRAARGRRDASKRLLLRRGRVGQGGLRRDRADVGRGRRGQRRARRQPGADQRGPLRRGLAGQGEADRARRRPRRCSSADRVPEAARRASAGKPGHPLP